MSGPSAILGRHVDRSAHRPRERARGITFCPCLGIEVEDVREGVIRLRGPVRDHLRNAPGAPVHGGVNSALAEPAVGGALGTVHEASAGGAGQTPLDLNVVFGAAVTGRDVFAEGAILRKGRSIVVGEARVPDTAGRFVAAGRATHMVLAR